MMSQKPIQGLFLLFFISNSLFGFYEMKEKESGGWGERKLSKGTQKKRKKTKQQQKQKKKTKKICSTSQITKLGIFGVGKGSF